MQKSHSETMKVARYTQKQSVEMLYTLPRTTKDIGETLSESHSNKEEKNREYLSKILQNVRFLARQGFSRYQFDPKPSPWDKSPGHDLKGAKTLPPGTIIVYKTPPLGTKQGVKGPSLGCKVKFSQMYL